MAQKTLLVTLLILVNSQSGFSEGDDFSQIYKRELDAQIVLGNFETFETARDRSLLSKDGLYARIADLQTKSNNWLNSWKTFVESSQQGATLENFSQTTLKFLKDQSIYYSEIAEGGRLSSEAIDLALLQLKTGSDVVQSENLLEYGLELKSQRDNIVATLEKIQLALKSNLALLKKMHEHFDVELFLTKAKLVATQNGLTQVDAALKSFKAILEAEKVILPAQRQLDLALRVFDRKALQLRYFWLTDHLSELDTVCLNAKNAANQVFNSDSTKQEFLTTIASQCQETKERVQQLFSTYTPQVIVKTAHKAGIKRISNRCDQPNEHLDCVSYQWIKDLNLAAFDTMTLEQLKNIELTWKKIENF